MLTEIQRSIIRATVPALQTHGEAITTHFYASLFAEHPGLLNVFNKANQRPGGQAANLAASILMYAANIDQLDKLGDMVNRIAHKHGSMEVQPEHYPVVGHHLLLAIKAVLGPAATDEVVDAWAAAYEQLAGIFTKREEELYDHCATQRGGWTGFKSFKVVRKVEESTTITSLYLVPEDGAALPDFVPGQYVSIKLKAPGDPHEQIRQYSLSCAPNPEYYRVSIGRELSKSKNLLVPDGVVSSFLRDRLAVGDTLMVHAPLGDFALNESHARPVVLISSGVGITPMLSMLEYLVAKPTRSVTFLHGTGNRKQHAFGKDVRQIAKQSAHIKSVVFYNEVDEEDVSGVHHDECGYIDSTMLQRHIGDLNADFYYCGSVTFLRAIQKALAELNIPADRQKSEAFVADTALFLELEETAA